ncbi:MAG: hypothetical protein GF401_18875 [Chitinivibrionales bacterium]|nr:hypothetical protein [Chitinivibrionales bacterium]
MIIGLIKSNKSVVEENTAEYGKEKNNKVFDHERLDIYHKSLELLIWHENPNTEFGIPDSIHILIDKASKSAMNIYTTLYRCSSDGNAA